MITGYCSLSLSFYITIVRAFVCGMKCDADGVAADTIQMLTIGFYVVHTEHVKSQKLHINTPTHPQVKIKS
jgi:hypothetical protein